MPHPLRYTTEDAAEYLKEHNTPGSIPSLKRWRKLVNKGPRFTRIAGRIYYALDDLKEFVQGEPS